MTVVDGQVAEIAAPAPGVEGGSPAVSQRASGILARLGYALGTSGLALGSTPINLFLLYYLTEIAGLRAALAGLAVALPKIWDAIVDPMFGGWIDRTAIRMGRRGPIVIVSSIAFVLSLILTFTLPHLASALQLTLLVTFLLIVSSTSMTAFNVSQYALASEMTANSRQLGGLLSLAGVVSQIFTIAGVAVAPILIDWAGGGPEGYSRMALLSAVASTPLLILFFLATHRIPVAGQAGSAATLSLWASIKATAENRPFYFLIAFMIAQGIGTAILFGFLPFANQYVLRGDAQSLSILEVVLFASVMVGMSLTPLLLRLTGTARAMRWCNTGIAATLSLLFAASFGPIWGTWLAMAATGIVSGAVGVLLQTAILEVARTKLKGGILVASGFYLGIMVAGTKLGTSAGGFVSGELLDWVGFIAGSDRQSAATVSWLRAGYTLTPLVFVVVAGVFLRLVVLPPSEDDDWS
jgi:GPH family glycoside/pentoside/hexuronide:cation symporter